MSRWLYPLLLLAVVASDARADDDESSRGLYGGLDLGVGIPAGGSALFGPGMGQALTFGYRSKEWRVQARLFEGYALRIDHEVGQVLDGELDPVSATIERSFDVGAPFVPVLGLGPAMVTSSIAVQSDSSGALFPANREGVGLALSAGIELPLGSGLLLSASVRGYLLHWENVGQEIIHDGDMDEVITGIDPKDGTPMTISVGVIVRP